MFIDLARRGLLIAYIWSVKKQMMESAGYVFQRVVFLQAGVP